MGDCFDKPRLDYGTPGATDGPKRQADIDAASQIRDTLDRTYVTSWPTFDQAA